MSFAQTLSRRAIDAFRKRSVTSLVRVACWIALVGLAVMCSSIIIPGALPVIFAMSVGQVIGIAAFLCYLLSVILDVARGPDHSPDAPGPARQFQKAEPSPPAEGSSGSA